MMVKATNYKNWCTENISPQSWARIILKCMSQLREKGLALNDLEDPDPELVLDADVLEALNQALLELYEMTVEESLLIRY